MEIGAKYVSKWDNGQVETDCTVWVNSGEVTDIQPAEVEGLNQLEKEYVVVVIEGKELILQLDDEAVDMCIDVESQDELKEAVKNSSLEPAVKPKKMSAETKALLKSIMSSDMILGNIVEAAIETGEHPWQDEDIKGEVLAAMGINLDTEDTELFKHLLNFFNGRQSEALVMN